MIFRCTSVRVFIYFLVVTAFFGVAAQMAKTQGALVIFEEHGFAEQVQFSCVVLSSVLLIFLSRVHAHYRGLLALSGAVGLFAAIRELNNTDLYRTIFFFGAASWVAAAIVFGFLFFRFRHGLPGQITSFLKLPATSLLVGGFVIVVGWAQVFAQSSIFPSKEVDRIVEEGLESAGYLLIFCGVIELFFNLKESGSNQRR